MDLLENNAGIRASILDCINEKFVLGEIKPSLARLLMAACTKRKNWSTVKPVIFQLFEEAKLDKCYIDWDVSTKHNTKVSVSVLSLAILSGNIDMFLDTFEVLFPLEHQLVLQNQAPHHPNLWHQLALNKMMTIKSKRIPAHKRYLLSAQLSVLLGSNSFFETIVHQSSLLLVDYQEFKKAWTTVQEYKNMFSLRKVFEPKVSFALIADMNPEETKDPQLLHRIMKVLVDDTVQHPERNYTQVKRWLDVYGRQFFTFLRHAMGSVMAALRRQEIEKMPVKLKRVTLNHKARAIQVIPQQCTITKVGQHLHINIPTGDKNSKEHKTTYRYITIKEEWLQLMQEASLVFVPSGSVLKHPFLNSRTKNQNGRVSNLKFGLETSQGLLYPGSLMKQCFPDHYDTGYEHGRNLNECIEVFRIKKKSRKAFNMGFWKKQSYLIQSFGLDMNSFRILSPLYARLDDRQKEMFLFYFWSSPVIKPFVDNLIQQPELLWFVKPFLDMLIKNLPAKQLYKQLTDQSFQYRLESLPLEMKAGELTTLMRVCQENSIMLVQQNFNNPGFIRDVFTAAKRMDLPVSPVMQGSSHKLWVLMHSFYIPAPLRRVMWQSLVIQREINQVYSGSLTRVEFKDDREFVVPNIFIAITPLERPIKTLYYDRSTGLMRNVKTNTGPVNNAFLIGLEIVNEEGEGISVFKEVLDLLWKRAIDKCFMMVYEDHFIGPTALDMMNHMDDNNFLFSLGYMSALCLCRGLYLPFPLSPDLWRYLSLGAEEVKSMDQVFTQRFKDCQESLKSQTTEDILLAFGESMSDYQGLTPTEIRDSIIRQNMLPKAQRLDMFRKGWQCLFSGHSLRRLITDLNDLFCEPSIMLLNVENFTKVFNRKNQMDELFIHYLKKLKPQELERLVEFITGKKRLPFVALGESPITVAWAESEETLPKAQNCINTLIVPRSQYIHKGSSKVQEERLRDIMSPIYEFDTIFGFS